VERHIDDESARTEHLADGVDVAVRKAEMANIIAKEIRALRAHDAVELP
jgi:hypothetical protein